MVDTNGMDTTAIASMATSMSNADLASKVSTSVARKTLDIAEQQGAALVAMIGQAGQGGPEAGKGANLDMVG